MYVYGKGDSLKHDIKFGIIEEGDYQVIEFKGGHNIPRLRDAQLRDFVEFFNE